MSESEKDFLIGYVYGTVERVLQNAKIPEGIEFTDVSIPKATFVDLELLVAQMEKFVDRTYYGQKSPNGWRGPDSDD